MKDIEAVDDHIRLLARWGDLDRIVFIHNAVLEGLAGKTMNRAASERFVASNRETIIAMAIRQSEVRPMGLNKIIVIDEIGE